jgi:AcrR family transcriptional regulator
MALMISRRPGERDLGAQPGPGARRSKGRREHDRGAEPASGDDQSGLRDAVLTATQRLLAEKSFADLAVSEILTAAGVSRGSF